MLGVEDLRWWWELHACTTARVSRALGKFGAYCKGPRTVPAFSRSLLHAFARHHFTHSCPKPPVARRDSRSAGEALMGSPRTRLHAIIDGIVRTRLSVYGRIRGISYCALRE